VNRAESLGYPRFLTLDGHWRDYALKSLYYFSYSNSPLENGIRRNRTS
jgi:hypothetical protein